MLSGAFLCYIINVLQEISEREREKAEEDNSKVQTESSRSQAKK